MATDHKKTLLILGAGGIAREISQLATRINAGGSVWGQIGFICDSAHEVGKQLEFGTVLGTDEWGLSAEPGTDCVIGIGIPRIKAKVIAKYAAKGFNWPNLIDPRAVVEKGVVRFGQGNVFTAGCVMTCSIEVGSFNLFNLNCTVGHDVSIGDNCVINPSANISGRAKLGSRVLCGVGCQILENVRIGNDVTIGAGAVVLKDVPDGQTVVGIPARPISIRETS